MRLSSMADYAVVTMCAAARHCGMTRVSAAELARETGLPLPTVQKLVSKLSGAGLLASQRGAAGGFVLAREAGAISLIEIIEAVEGPIALTSCVDEAKHDCALEQACKVKPHWAVVNGAVRKAFEDVRLDQLAGVEQEVMA